ncbi:hypothetical protein QE152_g22788 [Popillia japonica]|uniref:C2H2-type domain-containing protein n=1 Tax=Popillia japonica TaxID=7064 RepID=A0AAW1KHQ1_POPJA
MFPCKCGKEFATEAGLKSHIRRRYCKYRPDPVGEAVTAADTYSCTYCPRDCPREFPSYPGLRQHVRQADPGEFNDELLKEVADPIRDKTRWSDAEMIAMAKHEIIYKGRFINKHLNGLFPFRSVEAIKSKRRSKDYIELIESLQTEGAMARDIEEEIEEEAAAAAPEPTIELVEESILPPAPPEARDISFVPSRRPRRKRGTYPSCR